MRVAGLVISILMILAPSIQGAGNRPYYVGEKVCRTCHGGLEPHNPWSVWRLSAHSRAYAVLSSTEAWRIAEISGLDKDPQKSAICLGCHTTAAMAEEWEIDPAFAREDGVQCEGCHGPGSNYIDIHVMKDRERAMAAGLRMPKSQDCMVCHIEKGTHTAILQRKQFDPEQRLKDIAHRSESAPKEPPPQEAPAVLATPHYTGSDACGTCHDGPDQGYQWSRWRMSGHARAYAVLGTTQAKDIADRAGVGNDPQAAPECLVCHITGAGEAEDRFSETFDNTEGVGCESCHGAGSEYSREAAMRDAPGARHSGLATPDEASCRQCHNEKSPTWPGSFDYDAMVKKISHPIQPVRHTSVLEYKTPTNMALTRDGKTLYAACEASDSLMIIDTETRAVAAEIRIHNQPHDVCLSPCESIAYVTNRGDDLLSVIDTASRAEIRAVPVGDEPHGVLTDASGRTIYVVNTGINDVSVIDASTFQTHTRLVTGRGPWSLARTPDGSRIAVTNSLSHFVPFREPSRGEATVIDTVKRSVVERPELHNVNLAQGIDWSPGGEFALMTMLRTKNLVPMTRIAQGWVVTNALGILWKDGTTDQVLLDEPSSAFADATDVVIDPAGRYAYVTGSSVNEVAVIDLAVLKRIIKKSTPEERRDVLPDHMGYPAEFIVKRIAVGRCPRGIVITRDGRTVYVADALDDTISIIDTKSLERIGVIDLGGPKEISVARLGERVFHSAHEAFQNQFSCHTCHPDGSVDGLAYNIEPEGVGTNPVDNRTLRGILDTAPFKWSGKNPSLIRQCGPRLMVFFTRLGPRSDEESRALEYYICTIPRPPNRYRELNGELTPAQRRGKALYERAVNNMGEKIPDTGRCDFCHSGSYYTNRQKFDVGTMSELDTHGDFDVPHLNNIYETPPYLHDGRADTLEEIWTRFNPYDQHGVTNDMTKDQLNDLVEYLKTL